MRALILKNKDTEYEEKLVNIDSSLIYRHYVQNHHQSSYILEHENNKGFMFKGWIMGQKVTFFIKRANLLIVETNF
jgi:hypothetical protein